MKKSALAVVGHNNPPEPTPFEVIKSKINDLYGEARNWCDGKAIESQEQANEVQKLLRLIQEAEKTADACRVEENKPFDDGKSEVQARYAPLIANTKTTKGLTVLAVEACKNALAPWLLKIDEENRRIAEEARKDAEAKRLAAMEAAQHRDSLDGVEAFELATREARRAEDDARRTGNVRAFAKGEGRAVSLRDFYRPEITNYAEFARHVWSAHQSDLFAFLDIQATKIVAAGVHHGIPGVTVHHEKRPV